MRVLKQLRRFIIFPALLLFIAIIISGCKSKYEDLDLTMYQYRDTKNLVKLGYLYFSG